MRHGALRALAVVLGGLVALSVARWPGAGATSDRPAQDFLAATFGLDAGELRHLAERRPVVGSLDTADGREIATLGVIEVQVPAAFYIEELRNIAEFKRRHAAVLQIGTFSRPARIEDVAGLTLAADDVESLRRCRPGACKVQLPGEAIGRFQREVPWTTPEAAASANRVMREVLVETVNRYRLSGDAGLPIYLDQERPVSVAEEFQALIASPPAFLERFPPLHRHVLQFPDSSEPVEDVLYRSHERIGPAVVVSVTHLAIARLPESAPVSFAVASKQIFGTHYFDASLGLTILLDDESGPMPGSSLVYVNRSRIDALGGWLGGLKRMFVRSQTRSEMGDGLVAARDLVEGRFKATPRR